MEIVTYTNLNENTSYYLDIPYCICDIAKTKCKYLVIFKKYNYSPCKNIIGIQFDVKKSFTDINTRDIINLIVYKDKIYYPFSYMLQTIDTDYLDENPNNEICAIYQPKCELLFVNSIIRQIIGDPYFNWEYIY